MAKPFITLKNVQVDKTLEITANGPREATILIPTYAEDLELMEAREVEELIAKQVVQTATLGQPTILTPLPGAINHDGSVIIEKFDIDNFGIDPIVSVVFEISKSRDFKEIVFKKLKQGSSISDLDPDELNGYNLEANKMYYLRVKIYINNFSYSWSDTIHFTYTTSKYLTPVIHEAIIEQDDENETESIRVRKTGNITFRIDPFGIEVGAPGDPTNIEVYIKNREDLTGDFIKYTYEFNPTTNLNLSLIPLICFPGKSYHIKFAYYNSVLDIRSPFSNTISVDIPLPKYYFSNFYIAQNGAFISTTPTVILEDLVFDYNFIDYLYDDFEETLITEDERTLLKEKIKGSKFIYEFNLLKDGQILHRYNVQRGFEDVVNVLYKGLTFTITNIRLELSTDYTLYLTFKWLDKTDNPLSYTDGTPISKVFTTGNIYNIVPNDDLTQVYKEFNTFGYYGEITSRDLAPDTTYMGELKTAVTYKQNDEFSYRNDLFLVLQPVTFYALEEINSAVRSKKVVLINKDNVKDYYKSGLPTGEWLIKQLGIPTKTELSSGVINSKEGWIKCYNDANNIIYIAKKPFIADISFNTLEKLFLTSSYGRTIRIGKQLFAVRLLEDKVYSLINRRPIGFKGNVKKEIELFKALHSDLATYSQGDLGVASNKSVTFVSGGVIQSQTTGYSTNFKEKLNIKSKDIVELEKLADRKYYRPVLELIRTGQEPYREEKDIDYDPFTDTGYCGKVTGDDYINGIELKDRFKIANLHVDTPYPLYYKFYYHGLLIFIPTKPIGNGTTYNELESLNLVHPGEDSEQILNYRKYFFTLPTLTENVWLANDQFKDMPTYNVREFSDSIVRSLLSRVLTNSPITTNYRRWEDDEMPNINGIIYKDIVLRDRFEDSVEKEDKRVTTNNGTMVALSKDTPGFYLPMFFRESVDFDKDLTFPSIEFKEPTIVKEQVEVTKYRMEKKLIERERSVKKTRLESKTKIVMVQRQIGTGKYAYRFKERTPIDRYGILLFHAKKTDLANITEPLFRTSMLNITRNKEDNSKLTLYYSKNFRDLEEYIVKSCYVTDTRQTACEPLHVATFFNSSIQLRDYLTSLVREDIKILTLRNLIPYRVQTDDTKKHPLGLIYGKVASELAYYPISRNYELFNPLYQDIAKRVNLNPTISRIGNNYRNSWTTVEDELGNNIPIPILNSLLSAEDYSSFGNELINQYVNYFNSTLKDRVITAQEFRDDYLFGVVGLDLNTAYYLGGSGITYGTTLSPRYKIIDGDTRLEKYIGDVDQNGDLLNGKSNGKDFVDIKSERQEYITIEEEQEVMIEEEVAYFEVEKYMEEIWEQVPYTQTVEIEKVVQ